MNNFPCFYWRLGIISFKPYTHYWPPSYRERKKLGLHCSLQGLNLAAHKSALDEYKPPDITATGGSTTVENATRSARAHPYLATSCWVICFWQPLNQMPYRSIYSLRLRGPFFASLKDHYSFWNIVFLREKTCSGYTSSTCELTLNFEKNLNWRIMAISNWPSHQSEIETSPFLDPFDSSQSSGSNSFSWPKQF